MANMFHSGLGVLRAVADRSLSPSQLISQYASMSTSKCHIDTYINAFSSKTTYFTDKNGEIFDFCSISEPPQNLSLFSIISFLTVFGF